MRVEQREVGHDHRNRKRYRQYAGQRAERADKHADVRLGRHIAVTDCGHGYNGPPQSHRNGREVIVWIVLDALGVVDERREDDDADDEEEDEQHEFVSARFERVDEDLEPGRVTRQLEQSHDADDAEELEDVVLLQRRNIFRANDLYVTLYFSTVCLTLTQFCALLKTVLFCRAYEILA